VYLCKWKPEALRQYGFGEGELCFGEDLRVPYGIRWNEEAWMPEVIGAKFPARLWKIHLKRWRRLFVPGDLFQGHRSPAFRGQKLRILRRKAQPPYGYPHSSRVGQVFLSVMLIDLRTFLLCETVILFQEWLLVVRFTDLSINEYFHPITWVITVSALASPSLWCLVSEFSVCSSYFGAEQGWS